MTTIPYTSFETNTGVWPKGQAVSCEYQPIKTDVGVDSSDLLVRFSNLPAGVTVANPPTPIPYQAENSPLYITLYESDDDIFYRLMFEWNSLAERWDQDITVLVRDTNGNYETLDLAAANLNITAQAGVPELDGEFTIVLNSVEKSYYIFASFNDDIDIRYINNGRVIFEIMDNNGGVFTVVNQGSNAIVNTYTKVDNNTIRIPRSMDGAGVRLSDGLKLNQLHVLFNR